MIILANVGVLDPEAANFRSRALRDAVLCIGWIKLSSVIFYVILFFLTYMNGKGKMGHTLQVMTLIPIVPQVVLAVLLFLGAVEGKILVLQLSLLLCLIIGMYNTVLGVIGFIFFIQTGYLTMHFILAIMFVILSLSIFAVLCHDILIIQTYKEVIRTALQPTTDLQPHEIT